MVLVGCCFASVVVWLLLPWLVGCCFLCAGVDKLLLPKCRAMVLVGCCFFGTGVDWLCCFPNAEPWSLLDVDSPVS